MGSTELVLSRLTPRCGAWVQGLNLSLPMDPETAIAVTEALAEYGVLFFRDQHMTAVQHKSLARCFGELHVHPAWPRLVQGHPEVMEIYADENTRRIAGEDWHSDVSCDVEPPQATILYMLETPPSGGDTLFANAVAAYDAMSPPMQRFLAGLTALHDGEAAYRGRYEGVEEESKTYPRAEHPVVRTHPVSGRQALFVNRIFTTRLVELESCESTKLLDLLFAHIERPEFQCRFQWKPGSVAFWDNRCVQHQAMWDYFPQRRRARRVTIKGDVPYFVD